MKKIFFTIILYMALFNIVLGAASSGDSSQSNYKKGSSIILKAKKLEEKGKIEKAKKRYEKALKYLIKSNKEKPNQPDTLNYLGFALRKTGNLKEAEKYYLIGLGIDPNHNGINEYLGELYINTNRMELAKERLEVLKSCNCEEYQELKELIDRE
tara:strand:+ start:299 stop:763 length:465 start_codon:yes stop_codon:yes gene_type:complete